MKTKIALLSLFIAFFLSCPLGSLNENNQKENNPLLFGFPAANAQGVQNMEAIPGQARTNDFITYLEGLYKFGVAISAILAVFMISYGAFNYIVTSAGNAAKMAHSKEIIFNAIFGLVLALTAFLILFIINPDLVKGLVNDVPTLEKMIKG